MLDVDVLYVDVECWILLLLLTPLNATGGFLVALLISEVFSVILTT